jgi:Tfp pilus assembly protein PilO
MENKSKILVVLAVVAAILFAGYFFIVKKDTTQVEQVEVKKTCDENDPSCKDKVETKEHGKKIECKDEKKIESKELKAVKKEVKQPTKKLNTKLKIKKA